MKIFLSWSGEVSQKVARTLRDWLPSVIQSLRPYVSSEDINKGARWSIDIAKELEESEYGIICITKGNIDAPWVNFEAGALSKILHTSNVVPFLFGLKRSEVQGPLLQFQSVVYSKAEIRKLCNEINKRVPEESRLSSKSFERTFELWWPQLKQELDSLKNEKEGKPIGSSGSQPRTDEILEQILDLARTQHRLLKRPEVLLPAEYMFSLIKDLRLAEASAPGSPPLPAEGNRTPSGFIVNNEGARSISEIAKLLTKIGTALDEKGAVTIQGILIEPSDSPRFALRYARTPWGELSLRLELIWQDLERDKNLGAVELIG